MSAAQCESFACEPPLEAMLTVWRFDDQAKDPHKVLPPFGHYVPMLERLVAHRLRFARATL